jgi:hypothetical protein
MNFAVLHLSDLHSDHDDPQSNSWLLESLIRDRASYMAEGVPAPSLCIVTGDVVYGVRPQRTDADREVDRQYHQAEDFLVSLAREFFGGDRDKIVIVPGNHDVYYPGALAGMTPVATPATASERSELAAQLRTPHSSLRWSWANQAFSQVTNEPGYNGRFRPFAEFYARFYDGRRTYPLDPAQQYQIFDFPELRFCVLGLNSCYCNDPLRREGGIHPDCLANGSRALRQPQRAGWSAAAAWHHSMFGPPSSDDYLDAQVLHILMTSGVSLVFHGHQHRQDCIEERFRLGPSPRRITVISAGTLCAGSRNLVPGIPRSYNVVELNGASFAGRAHVRNMLSVPPQLPLWGPGLVAATGTPSVDFEICPPLTARPENLDAQLQLERASDLVGKHEWASAVDALGPISAHPLARPLLLQSLVELHAFDRIESMLYPLQSAAEAVAIGGTIFDAGTREQAARFAARPEVIESKDASVLEVLRRIRERIRL